MNVVNLHVYRETKKREVKEKEESEGMIFMCKCGSSSFSLYDVSGLTCIKCRNVIVFEEIR